MSTAIKYRVTIDGEDTGVWTWKDWKDFMAFLTLMHTQTLARMVDEDKSEQFNASYVFHDRNCGTDPILKQYVYKREVPE